MLDDNYLMLGPKVDLNKVERIPTKRLTSFLNFFVSETASFLNKFASTCEERLNKMDAKMQDIETLLHILESKISSVPGLDDIKPPSTIPSNTSNNTHNKSDIKTENEIKSNNVEKEANGIPNSEENKVSELENERNKVEDLKEGWVANKNNPLYKRFFTMLNVGIPMQAVKQKMIMEEFDPSILEKPNELGEVPTEEDEDDDEEED